MRSILNRYFFLQILLGVGIVLSLGSCKKNKKLAELSDPEAEKEAMLAEVEQTEPEEEEEIPFSREPSVVTAEQKVDQYFKAISAASSTTSANASIQETLSLFESPDAPLLIVFYEADGKESYDEPTTIEKYLNYLKDTKNKPAKVSEIVTDETGRIKEIVLKK
ncbi:MAG: nucleoid-structuring protein H-NS [Bacteroidota bacterium]